MPQATDLPRRTVTLDLRNTYDANYLGSILSGTASIDPDTTYRVVGSSNQSVEYWNRRLQEQLRISYNQETPPTQTSGIPSRRLRDMPITTPEEALNILQNEPTQAEVRTEVPLPPPILPRGLMTGWVDWNSPIDWGANTISDWGVNTISYPALSTQPRVTVATPSTPNNEEQEQGTMPTITRPFGDRNYRLTSQPVITVTCNYGSEGVHIPQTLNVQTGEDVLNWVCRYIRQRHVDGVHVINTRERSLVRALIILRKEGKIELAIRVLSDIRGVDTFDIARDGSFPDTPQAQTVKRSIYADLELGIM